VHFLVVFFSERLQDFPCINEVISGLLALAKNQTLSEEEGETIARG
jgi:hypothetical protein